ncbi:MAG: DUF4330 domain-containing protein [Solirubrobacterales bacterium]
MSLVDEKGKLFGKINLIDLAAILFVILLVVVVWVRGHNKVLQVVQAPPQILSVSVIVEEIRPNTAAAMSVGSPIWESKTGALLGKVSKVEVLPAERWVETATGQVARSAVPGKNNVILSIEGPGRMDDTTTLLGGTEMRIGSKVNVRGARYSVEGYVWNSKALKRNASK